MSRVVGLVLVAMVLAAGCALTEPDRRPRSFDTPRETETLGPAASSSPSPEPQPGSASLPAEPVASPGLVVSTEEAARACSTERADVCELCARRLQGEPSAALTVLRACMANRGFADLPVLLQHWRPLLDSPAGRQLLFDVLGSRGGQKSDVKLLRARGYRIWTLDEALAAGKKAIGQQVLVRGEMVEERDEAGRKLWVVAEHEDEGVSTSGSQLTVWSTRRGDVATVSPIHATTYSAKETGNRVLLTGPPPGKVRARKDHLFLGRVDSLRAIGGADGPDLFLNVQLVSGVAVGAVY